MKRFDNTELWDILKTYDNTPAIATVRLNESLDDFIARLHSFCRGEKNIAERTRILNYYRGKLSAFMEGKVQASKKHTVLRIIIKRAISSIDSELFLIKMDLEHPERFVPAHQFDFAPRAQWNGTLAELLEVVIALSLSGLIRTLDGRQLNLIEVAGLFEEIFGLKISDLYGRKTRLLTRKKNESPFLESLLFHYRKEVEKMSL